MSTLVDIFFQPGKAFAELKERPTFVFPFALTVVLSALMTFLYFHNVDSNWYYDHMFAAKPDMTAKDIAQAKAVMPGTAKMSYFMPLGVLVFAVVMALLMSVYYLLAGKVTGNAVSFRHALALSTWPAMPGLLGIVVALVGVVTMDPKTSLESLQLLHHDPLLVDLPLDNRWSALAKGFSLLAPWSWLLAALGWKTWGRTGWGQAVVVAILPFAVVYAGMIGWVLLK